MSATFIAWRMLISGKRLGAIFILGSSCGGSGPSLYRVVVSREY
jgi:hypothetical protein